MKFLVALRQALSPFALMVISFLGGVSASLFLLPFWVSPFLSAVQKGNPSDWIGFAGNVGAGIMTIVAAGIAWFAVQQQISSERALEEDRRAREANVDQRRKGEAKEVAVVALSQPVVTASMLRMSVRAALGATTQQDAARWDKTLDQAIGWVEDALSQHTLRQIVNELSREDRMHVLMFLTQLGTLVSIHRTQLVIHDRDERLKRLRMHLDNLPKYLGRFDNGLLSLFEK